MTLKNSDSDIQTMLVLLLQYNVPVLFSCVHFVRNEKKKNTFVFN